MDVSFCFRRAAVREPIYLGERLWVERKLSFGESLLFGETIRHYIGVECNVGTSITFSIALGQKVCYRT